LYLVGLKDSDLPIGICGLLKRDSLDDIDIGFAFLERFWGHGYAFEAASAVMDYGRNLLRLPRIVAITAPDNQASIKILEKVGLRFVRMISLPGYSQESRLFTSDWEIEHVDHRESGIKSFT
jgi:RimJ/RimL family protein N-acetyltransferase